MKYSLGLLLMMLVIINNTLSDELNDRPIIGILTQKKNKNQDIHCYPLCEITQNGWSESGKLIFFIILKIRFLILFLKKSTFRSLSMFGFKFVK